MSSTKNTQAAVWFRVSTGHQDSDNQVPDVERFAEHHGYDIAERYSCQESAWNGGKDGGEYKRTLKQALDDAHAGKFKVLIVWASTGSPAKVPRGCCGSSASSRARRDGRIHQGDLAQRRPEIQDVLVSFAGWMAQQESTRRSERIRAGLERRKAEGRPVGRQPGSKDKKPRKRSGYVERWENERAATERADAPRKRTVAATRSTWTEAWHHDHGRGHPRADPPAGRPPGRDPHRAVPEGARELRPHRGPAVGGRAVRQLRGLRGRHRGGMMIIALDPDHQTDPDYLIELDTAGRDLDQAAPMWCEYEWVYPDDDIAQEPYLEQVGPGGMTVAEILEEWESAQYSPGWSPG